MRLRGSPPTLGEPESAACWWRITPATFQNGYKCAPPNKLWVGVRTLPGDDESTLQPEAILVVIVAAECQIAAISEASVEILCLDESYGEFFVQLDVKAAAGRQGESILGIGDAVASSVVVATEFEAIPAEIHLEKWLELAAISIGEPWAEHIGKITPAKFCTQSGDVITKIFAATHVSSNANHAAYVVGDRATTASAVKAFAKGRARNSNRSPWRNGEGSRGADEHECR